MYGQKTLKPDTCTVRYHSWGSMKFNARILHLVYMVYLKPKHNSLLAWHTHSQHDMYKVGIMSEAHGTIPLIIPLVLPLCLESPSPVPDSLLLTWNPSFACGAIPVHSGPRLLAYWPPPYPFPSHSLFPLPNGSPKSNMCPPTTTLRHRLHTVWYMYNQKTC